MKNVIFISPNFPTNYWQFCRELKNDGLNVLGIGDQPYDELTDDQKASLTEYYKVNTLESYDEVYRAVAFYIFKYGRIDFIESNNEYWLEQDAMLRTDFNVRSGFLAGDLPRIKYKSKMKEYYEKAGIPVARYHLVDTARDCRTFIGQVGYPVIAKPDNGVGASDTRKLENDDDLINFFLQKEPEVSYILEEYIDGEINSYDAIYDSEGQPIFEAGNCTPISIMDSVNLGAEATFYIEKDLAEDTLAYGRATAKSFGVKSRFVHFEFFRLSSDHEGLGKKGELVALEVNMRPSGGLTPDMINYARETDVYKIWADMVAHDGSTKKQGAHHYCAYAGLRSYRHYRLSHEDIMRKYGKNIRMTTRLDAALSDAMGDIVYIAVFERKGDVEKFFRDLLETMD